MAMAIVVFCLTVLTGLLMVGLSGNKASGSETTATNVLAGIVSDLRATPTTTPTSLLYKIPIPANPVTAAPGATTLFVNSDGSVTANAQSPGTFLVTVNFIAPTSVAASGTRTCTATFANVKVSWPGAASAASPLGSSRRLSPSTEIEMTSALTNRGQSSRAGFTLVEVLVSMSVLILLMSILAGMFNGVANLVTLRSKEMDLDGQMRVTLRPHGH